MTRANRDDDEPITPGNAIAAYLAPKPGDDPSLARWKDLVAHGKYDEAATAVGEIPDAAIPPPPSLDVERAKRVRERMLDLGWSKRTIDVMEAADVKRAAIRAVADWDHRGGRALVLCGDKGVGKTVAAAWVTAQRDLRCRFLRAAEFARMSRFADNGYSRFEEVLSSRALCLDDLGAEYADDRGSLRTSIDELVDRFYADRRTLIITTNGDAAAFGERYGERVVDRLREANWVQVGGTSMRGKR